MVSELKLNLFILVLLKLVAEFTSKKLISKNYKLIFDNSPLFSKYLLRNFSWRSNNNWIMNSRISEFYWWSHLGSSLLDSEAHIVWAPRKVLSASLSNLVGLSNRQVPCLHLFGVEIHVQVLRLLSLHLERPLLFQLSFYFKLINTASFQLQILIRVP